MIKRVWNHRHLVSSLVRRQYQVRYRQSFVGLVWAIVPPLGILAAGTVIFRGIAEVETQGAPYQLVTMAAMIPWMFFINSFSFGVTSVVQASQMVTRLSFPRGVLPVAAVGTALVDLAISTGIFILLAIFLGHSFPASAVWFVPLLILEVPLIAGITLFGSAVNVFARDMRLAVPLVAQFWLLFTPVMYPLSEVEGLRGLFLVVNPMTGLVESFKNALVFGSGPTLELMLPTLIGATVLFVVGLWYFSATESRFADVI